MYVYKELYSLSDLVDRRVEIIDIPSSEIRICVLDDEGFDICPLNSLGFKTIHRQLSFEDIEAFKDYDVVLCDVDGIGKKINGSRQGIAVAEQLKQVYPNQIVYLYTGKNLADYGAYSKLINRVVYKPTPADELAKYIKNDINDNANPEIFWTKFRSSLLEKGTSIKTIAFLESMFVSSILKKKNFFNEANLRSKSELTLSVSSDIISILSIALQLMIPYVKIGV